MQIAQQLHHQSLYEEARTALRLAYKESASANDTSRVIYILRNIGSGFRNTLYQQYRMSQTEYRICMLIKCGVSLSEIQNILNMSKQNVSSVRKRLMKKFFSVDAPPNKWDEYIRSL